MRINVDMSIANDVDRLLRGEVLILKDGKRSRKIANSLGELRNDGSLLVGFDRNKKRSILIVNGKRKKRRTNHQSWKTSTFYL